MMVEEAVIPMLCLLLALQSQVLPPRDTAKHAAGTATVRGRVTDKATGQPIARASVQIMLQTRGTTGQSYRTATGPDGRYDFPDLPAGEYDIYANAGEHRSGYLSQAFGEGTTQPRPFGATPLLALAPGEVRSVDFALPRSFAIAGRVVNEYGEGLADVRMTVERLNGGRSFETANTDDRGDFRLFGLRPGEYRVCARAYAGGQGDRATEGDALQTRYVRTCFPTGGSAAVSVTSSDVEDVLIRMQRGRGLALSGRVVNEAGGRPESVEVYLTLIEGADGYPMRPVPLNVAGHTFSARGLTPGDYLLRAAVKERDTSRPRELASVPLTLDTADVTDLVVVMSAGATVSGRVVLDGDAPPTPRGRGIAIRTRRDMDGDRVYRQDQQTSALVKDDMTFELTRLHGPVIVGVYGLPDGWILKSVRYRGTDITDLATSLASSAEPRDLEVVITNRTARVIVRMPLEDVPSDTRVLPLLIPVDPSRWKAGVITASSSPSREGTLTFPPVRPGEYFAAAVVVDDLVRLRRDLEAIKAVTAAAQRVTLRDNETYTLDVRLVRLPEDRRQ